MEIVEGHRSPLNRQIHEGVELDTNAADIVMNSKAEWNHCRIPRVVIEVGDEVEEDTDRGMSRSTETLEKERKTRGMKKKKQEKRMQEEKEGSSSNKRQKIDNRQQERQCEESRSKKGKPRKADKKTEEDEESNRRLRGWIEAYGLNNKTR